jgi:hypothetical protein
MILICTTPTIFPFFSATAIDVDRKSHGSMESSRRHASMKSLSYPHTAFERKQSAESAGSSSTVGFLIVKDKRLAPVMLADT